MRGVKVAKYTYFAREVPSYVGYQYFTHFWPSAATHSSYAYGEWKNIRAFAIPRENSIFSPIKYDDDFLDGSEKPVFLPEVFALSIVRIQVLRIFSHECKPLVTSDVLFCRVKIGYNSGIRYFAMLLLSTDNWN